MQPTAAQLAEGRRIAAALDNPEHPERIAVQADLRKAGLL